MNAIISKQIEKLLFYAKILQNLLKIGQNSQNKFGYGFVLSISSGVQLISPITSYHKFQREVSEGSVKKSGIIFWNLKLSIFSKWNLEINFIGQTSIILAFIYSIGHTVWVSTTAAKKIHPFASVWYEIGVHWPNIKPIKSHATALGL